MKKKLLLLFFCICIYANTQFSFSQEEVTYTNEAYKELSPLIEKDVSLYQNSILYNIVMPLANLGEFNSNPDAITHSIHFKRAWQELYDARITKTDKHITEEKLEEIATNYQKNGTIQIGIINADFTQLKESFVKDIQEEEISILQLSQRNNYLAKTINKNEYPYEDKHVFLVCPLTFQPIQVISNTDVFFEVGQLGLDISLNKIKTLNVSCDGKTVKLFENGNLINTRFSFRFDNSGTKTMFFQIGFTNGKIMNQEAKFPVTIKTFAKKEVSPIKIRATIPFRGYDEPSDCFGDCFGEGEYQVFLSNKNTKLSKPLIILDGFDPGDLRKIDNGNDGIVSLINKNGEEPNMKRFSDNGFDVVILNFPKRIINTKTVKYWHPFTRSYVNMPVTIERDGGSDYIERNANVLKALIVKLNEELNQNGSNEKLKIIGPSMGGLISRVALTEMENANQEHNVDTWVSFDSPHLGANIPVGLQYFFNFMELDQVETLKTPAAKQMLVTQIVDETYTTRNEFKSKLSYLGFPLKTRNLALINGSINGKRVGTPKEKMLFVDLRALNTPLGSVFRYQINTFSTHDGGKHKIFERYKRTLFSKKRHSAYLNDNTDGGSIDNSPGGYFDMKHEFEDFLGVQLPLTNWNAGNAVNKLFDIRDKPAKFGIRVIVPILLSTLQSSIYLDIFQDKPSFIPTKSALAYRGYNKLLHEDLSTRNLVCSNEIPFDSFYAPNDNEEHITLNSNNMDWILEELNGNPQPIFNGFKAVSIYKNNTVYGGFTDTHHSEVSLIASNIVFPNANANYSAVSQIILRPGFHARQQSTFRAKIQSCSNLNAKQSKSSKNRNSFLAFGKIDHNLSEKNEKGISQNEEVTSIAIYPNPNSGIFSISTNNFIASYKIVNQIGKTIINKTFVNQRDVTIDIQKYPLGIYFIQLQLENGEIEVKKVIKN